MSLRYCTAKCQNKFVCICNFCLSPVKSGWQVLFWGVINVSISVCLWFHYSVHLSVHAPKRFNLLQIKTKMSVDAPFIAPPHSEGWTVKVQVKNAKMLESFFGCNSTAHSLIYFKYIPQYSRSWGGYHCCVLHCRVSCKTNLLSIITPKYQVIQHVMVHVETTQRKLDISVHFHTKVEVPPKSFQVQTQYLSQNKSPKNIMNALLLAVNITFSHLCTSITIINKSTV